MSVHVIYYKDGAKRMRPVLTRESYLKLRGSKKQKATLAAVREGDEEKKAKLVQMNYSCQPNEDGTLKGSTRMSNSVGMDVDHIAAEEMEVVKERILEKKEALGLLMLERSARGQGFHLVFRRAFLHAAVQVVPQFGGGGRHAVPEVEVDDGIGLPVVALAVDGEAAVGAGERGVAGLARDDRNGQQQ